MRQSLSRREFVAQSAAAGLVAGLGFHASTAAAADSKSPNETLNLACIGTGNKGGHNIAQLSGQNIYALCDIDTQFLGAASEKYPKASKHRDYRKMLDAVHGKVDGVVVSTPDHMHAPCTEMALELGKPVYCEKPLTHTIAEARRIAELAAEKKVATQMGTQIHASDNYRRVVELVQGGAIGTVREVYTWCNKGWFDGRYNPDPNGAPKHVDWNLWLGVAAERPYSPGLHPFFWRRFWDFGNGTFGDMAAHIMDLPYWALGLKHPSTVFAKGPEVHPDGAPQWCMAEYTFAATKDRPELKFFWSDGGKHHAKVQGMVDAKGKPITEWSPGALFVGDDGMLGANYREHQLFPLDKFADYQRPAPSIPASIGHWNEWVEAIKTGSPTTCNFGYAGPLTEHILLGVLAYRTGQKIEWDAKNLKAVGLPEADELLHKQYRSGW